MELTHWKKLTNPDYLGAYALEPGKDLITTIKAVKSEMVVGADGKKEECTVMYFAEKDIKPMILNVTNAKQIQKLLKTPYVEQWADRKIQIGVEKVKAFGELVEALRVRPFLPKDDELICADCKNTIQPFGNSPAKTIAVHTQAKYGRPLCSACAGKIKAKQEAQAAASDVLGATQTGEVNDG